MLNRRSMKYIPNSEAYITVGDVPLHTYFFSYAPNKPICIMLHGHRSDTIRMLPVIKFLEEKYNMIGFDLPGFGKSTYCPPCDNYIDLSVDIFDGFLKELDVNTEEIAVVGVSLGGNILVNYLLKHPQTKFKKIGLVAPIYSYKNLSMKPLFKKFVYWITRKLSRGGLITKLTQRIINSDRLFSTVVKCIDYKLYSDESVVEYERSQWRLMTMQHWGKSLNNLLHTDYSNSDQVFHELKDVVFVYPKRDQYIDAPVAIEKFKRMFPHARFNRMASEQHIPRGNYSSNPEFIASMRDIIDALA